MAKNSIEKAAGEPLTLELGGKTYKIFPYTLGDYVALRSHIKSQRITDFLASAKELEIEERTKVLVELSSQTISEYELMQETQSPQGMIFMLWRALIKSDPNLKLEKMEDIIDDSSMEELLSITEGLNKSDAEELKKAVGEAAID